jgi:hypothetical protein
MNEQSFVLGLLLFLTTSVLSKTMPKTLEQLWLEELRLKFLQILYESESPLRAKTVRSLLNQFNYPLDWQAFMRQVSWLVSEELIRCFPSTLKAERSEPESRQYVNYCLHLSFDSPDANNILLKIRSKARHFLECNEDGVKGVATP